MCVKPLHRKAHSEHPRTEEAAAGAGVSGRCEGKSRRPHQETARENQQREEAADHAARKSSGVHSSKTFNVDLYLGIKIITVIHITHIY